MASQQLKHRHLHCKKYYDLWGAYNVHKKGEGITKFLSILRIDADAYPLGIRFLILWTSTKWAIGKIDGYG